MLLSLPLLHGRECHAAMLRARSGATMLPCHAAFATLPLMPMLFAAATPSLRLRYVDAIADAARRLRLRCRDAAADDYAATPRLADTD